MANMFRFGTRELPLDTPQVMGILNVTPDSFSDGGQLYQGGRVALDDVLHRAAAMVDAGATLLDVGGESTRPGADPVSEQQELDRVVPVVEALAAEFDVVVSVDTSTASVIEHSAAVGAGLINDVRALQRDGALQAAAASGLPVCLMHMQGQPRTMQDAPEYQDVVAQVGEFLQSRMQACVDAGIDSTQLLLDPGFGFGKSLAHNLQLLQRLDRLQSLGAPLLVGVSRKSMIGALLDKEVDQRLYGSLAAAALALVKGAWILRVHDVEATQDVAKVCQAVMQADA
ncbi:dihydropteroate synthase [Motiliproteus sp.]|uniref:dihydropteroate synthase n=1 Tax=Motiliproteus sp. TaxID=1898955 RepID=UPI003BAD3F46